MSCVFATTILFVFNNLIVGSDGTVWNDTYHLQHPETIPKHFLTKDWFDARDVKIVQSNHSTHINVQNPFITNQGENLVFIGGKSIVPNQTSQLSIKLKYHAYFLILICFQIRSQIICVFLRYMHALFCFF